MDADSFYVGMLVGTLGPLGVAYVGIQQGINYYKLKKRLDALYGNAEIMKAEGKLTEKMKKSVSSAEGGSSIEYRIKYEFQVDTGNGGYFLATKSATVSSKIYNQLPEADGKLSVVYSKQDVTFNFPEIEADRLRNSRPRGIPIIVFGCVVYIGVFTFMMISSAGLEPVPESTRMSAAISSVLIFVLGCIAAGSRAWQAPKLSKEFLGETVIKGNQEQTA